MTNLQNILKVIQMNSSVSKKDQDAWKHASDASIDAGEVEALTSAGLCQAIDLFGWHLATDTMLCSIGLLTEEEQDEILDIKSPMMDDIRDEIALSSGIHPKVVMEMVLARADYYTELYFEQELNNDRS